MSIENIWGKLRGLNSNGLLDTLTMLGGKLIWLDGYNGNDNNYGHKDSPLKTLEEAYDRADDGKHDVIVLKSTGVSASLCTVRLDAALTWAKNNLHMVAQTPASVLFSPRARIAPTSTTTAFANYITMTGDGCFWSGIQIWNGFTTGTTSQIALTLNAAQRNYFHRCHIVGMADNASAQNANSSCIKFTTDASENLFEECVIGTDTVTRTVANASMIYSGAGSENQRNVFKRCIFPIMSTSTDAKVLNVDNLTAIQKFTLFEDCVFWNYGTATMTGLVDVPGSSTGYVAFIRPSVLGLITGFSFDAASRALIYITGPTDGSTVSGVGYAPSA